MLVPQVSAVTYDGANNITYGLRSSSPGVGVDIFQINEISGEITIKDGTLINAEDVALYTLVVEAQDRRQDPIRYFTVSCISCLATENRNFITFCINFVVSFLSFFGEAFIKRRNDIKLVRVLFNWYLIY